MIGRSGMADCRRHASALLELADPRVPTAGSRAALDHLEWCHRCSGELQELALAIVAMQRFGEASAIDFETASAWPSLSARIVKTRAAAAAVAWRWRASLAGLAAGTLVVAAVVGPLALHVPLAGGIEEPTGFSAARLEVEARRSEATYIWQASTGSLFGIHSASTTGGYAGPRRYPDDIVPERKEVPVRTTGRVPKAD